MATITFKLRGNGENETIYYRFRPNKNFDLTSATPFKINFTDWDNKNQRVQSWVQFKKLAFCTHLFCNFVLFKYYNNGNYYFQTSWKWGK